MVAVVVVVAVVAVVAVAVGVATGPAAVLGAGATSPISEWRSLRAVPFVCRNTPIPSLAGRVDITRAWNVTPRCYVS